MGMRTWSDGVVCFTGFSSRHDIMSQPVYRDYVLHCLSMSKKGGAVMIFPEEELETRMDDIEKTAAFGCLGSHVDQFHPNAGVIE